MVGKENIKGNSSFGWYIKNKKIVEAKTPGYKYKCCKYSIFGLYRFGGDAFL